MVARRLQRLLETLYDVDPNCDVQDFLVTDRAGLTGIAPCNDTRSNDEQLLLSQTAEGAEMRLFIDAQVLRRLEMRDPERALTERNLADFCTALEGVSQGSVQAAAAVARQLSGQQFAGHALSKMEARQRPQGIFC